MVERFSSGGPFEPIMGYSRVVRAGPWVLVAGTTATGEGGAIVGDTAEEQTRQILHNIESALARAGAELADVVQTRVYLTDMTLFPQVAKVHGAVFADVLPVNATVQVAGLADPSMLVEIEATAYSPLA